MKKNCFIFHASIVYKTLRKKQVENFYVNMFRYDEELILTFFDIIKNLQVRKIIIRLRSSDDRTNNRTVTKISEEFERFYFQTYEISSNRVSLDKYNQYNCCINSDLSLGNVCCIMLMYYYL